MELFYAMFEFFGLTAGGQVHFRVATSDGLVELGSADLPPPREPRPEALVFCDARYFGEAICVAALRRALDGPIGDGPARTVLIQVCESTR